MGKKVKKQDQTLNEFYQRQEELQEKVNGNNSVLRLSNKDYNE